MDERAFYHSFPRPRDTDTRGQTIEKGLKILQSVRDTGLTLAPELVHWKIPQEIGGHRPITNKQCRACFTELHRDELPEHGKRFGPFSLEFKVDVLRQLGALPVIYIPQHLQGSEGLSAVGAVVVATMSDIRYTINSLRELANLTNKEAVLKLVPGAKTVADDCVVTLNNQAPGSEVKISSKVLLRDVDSILKYIGFRVAPFDLMVGALTAVESLFYPTDDIIHDKFLAYYRQREWRLLAGLITKGIPNARAPKGVERETLLKIDPVFWTREIGDDKERFLRIDAAQIVTQFNGHPFSDSINAVLVPPEAESEARTLLGNRVTVIPT